MALKSQTAKKTIMAASTTSTSIEIPADTVLSCIGNDNPLVYEGEAETLFFENSFIFHYYPGIILIFVSYVFSIGIMLWYIEKKE